MYLRIILLFSFSLLCSFYLINYLNNIVSSPESVLENFLYNFCSPLDIDSERLNLDFQVDVTGKTIHITVLGLQEDNLFRKSTDEIYHKVKRKAVRKEIVISILDNNNDSLYSQKYKKYPL